MEENMGESRERGTKNDEGGKIVMEVMENSGIPQDATIPKNGDPTPSKFLSLHISWIP
jgi:hypothetical protein